MSIVDQIEQLTAATIEKNEQFYTLEKALTEYHKMVESGFFKPRENQLQQIYTHFPYQSNY